MEKFDITDAYIAGVAGGFICEGCKEEDDQLSRIIEEAEKEWENETPIANTIGAEKSLTKHHNVSIYDDSDPSEENQSLIDRVRLIISSNKQLREE